jgi:hypothetical protein
VNPLGAALDDWRSGRAYLDGAGNYRLRSESMHTAGRLHYCGRGKVAPWNKTAKRAFQSAEALHRAAHTQTGG